MVGGELDGELSSFSLAPMSGLLLLGLILLLMSILTGVEFGEIDDSLLPNPIAGELFFKS